MKIKLNSTLVAGIFFLLSNVQAETLNLSGAYKVKQNTLSVSVTNPSSHPDCSIEVYAARKKSQLKSDVSAATRLGSIRWAEGGGAILARQIEGLRVTRTISESNIYLKAVSECEGESSNSAVVALSIPRQATGIKALGAWLANLPQRVLTDGYRLEKAFTNLSFDKPVDLQSPADGLNKIYVVEQSGTIRVFDNNSAIPESSVFLDISDSISFNPDGGERGLLGLAFHPDYAENGYFYVNYTEAETGATVIARYQRNPGNPIEALTAEFRILVIDQPYSNHNGGQIAFGPDGFLYIGMGDGGSANDPQGYGQNRQELLGKMLRIDVDGTSAGKNYRIPASNPFVGSTRGFREEIFAWGLRNPWRFSFDMKTGNLWAGDVGQNTREEIDLIRLGENYGWNTMEGNLCFEPEEDCDRSGLTLPVLDYPRESGSSVTGGYVYRGSELPDLKGVYIFADFITGRIWGAERARSKYVYTQLYNSDSYISGFGQDQQKNLYILDYLNGIYKLVKVQPD